MTQVSGSGASGDGTAEVRVVCADDAPDALAQLRLQLSQFAEVHVLEAVPDGARAVEAVMRLRPNLVVLDVAMPVMDGLEAAQHLRTQLAETKARVEATELPAVWADRTQLVQLVQNLVANAVTYVAPGVTPLVRLAGAPSQDGWQVTVTDNGVGIPAREREQAFRLFHRLGDVEAHAGTGVGLALCRRIVTRHGGRIWLDDGTDDGTCVRFTLPDPRPPTDSARGLADKLSDHGQGLLVS